MTRGCLRGTWCGRSPDLADHMLGDNVETGLAKEILGEFLVNETVTCNDIKPEDKNAMSLALEAAYADTVEYACIRGSGGQTVKSTRKPKTRYRWDWRDFPAMPIDENELVVFLNGIADSALSIARSIRKDRPLQAKNRFAAPVDKHHAIPLSYEPDGEDMRPDFMVLPLTAFSNDPEREVKEAYVNFTAMLLVGESKSASNARDGITQVQRYIRGIRRARPWQMFAIGMSVGKNLVTLSRGDGSGLERIEISLTDGRGCIEFIRTILGIVLADEKEFGRNPEIDIEERDVSLVVPELSAANTGTKTATSGAAPATPPTSGRRGSSRPRNPTAPSNLASVNQPSATSSTGITSDNTATGSKRGPDDEMSPGKGSKKQKRTVVFRAFVPVRVYGRECTGVLFTSASIRGRGTTVYVVVGADGGQTYSALKTSWQDVDFAGCHAAVLEKLSGREPHPNVIIPMKLLNRLAEDHKVNSTLCSIRGFLGDEIQKLPHPVENRILTVTTSDLQRPVAYFWSPHDFVRGVLGALLGHEYLCEIGILHRDISENNIVLSLCRGGLGALIDFDMATVGRPNMHHDSMPLPKRSKQEYFAAGFEPPAALPASDEQHKAQRTGTTPYMSIGVLKGNPHTHFDDIESFLYVLVLFFLSYKGPLEAGRLSEARVQGFIQPVGMGRLPHVTTWPAMIGRWRSGTVKEMSEHKSAILGADHCDDFTDDYLPNIRTRWEHVSQSISRAILDLVYDCWMMFSIQRRQVTHRQFIEVLKAWLTQYEDEENTYVYPFE